MQASKPINPSIFRDSDPAGCGVEALELGHVQLAWPQLSRQGSRLAWSRDNVPEFLCHFGLALPGEPCKLTWAGLLLFGKQSVLQELLPGRRILVEAQFLDPDGYDYHADLDGNLFEVFHGLMAFVRTHYPAGGSFAHPGFPCLRDAVFGEMISNLLLHRNYGAEAPARLLFRKDRVSFENPARPRQRGLLDLAAVESFPGNRILYAFFREAGWIPEPGRGLDLLAKRGEEYFGIPLLVFDRENFKVVAPTTLEFPVSRASAVETMQASRGSAPEAVTGAPLPSRLEVRTSVAIAPPPSANMQALAGEAAKLENQPNIAMKEAFPTSMQTLASTMQASGSGIPVDEPEHPSDADERVRKILEFCEVPRNREEIQKHVGLNNRDHFRKHVLLPLLREGRLLATIPDKPNSPKQQYRTAPGALAGKGF